MHAGFDELSAMAAGQAQPGLHVAGCPICREELRRIRALRRRLVGLPGWHAGAGGLERAESRLRERVPRRALPLAAGVLALVAAAIVVAGRPPRDAASAADWVPDRALVAENARLEALLAALPESRRIRLSSAYTVAALEQRLAWVDDRLTAVTLEPHAPEVEESLWKERVTLMNSLVQVEYARTLASR
jgi:hypothetical protein